MNKGTATEIYKVAQESIDEYTAYLNQRGDRTTLEGAVSWATLELHHHDRLVMLLTGMTLHLMALDRAALAQGEV